MEQLIKCIIVEDESPAIKLMESYVQRCPQLKLEGSFRSPVQAIQFLRANSVDVIFCDIQMPEMTGINMVKVLDHKPEIVFTTAYAEFAADAFEVDAVDYLRKPFSFERFMKSLNKVKDQLYVKKVWKQDGMQMDKAEKKFLVIKSDHKMIKLMYDEILYVEAFQEYVKIYTETDRYITLERMKNLETILPADEFLRVHRSYIVARSKVRSVSGNLLQIGDNQIPVSREMKEQVARLIF